MENKLWLAAGLFLVYCAYSDLRSGLISVRGCLVAAGAGTLFRIWMGQGMVCVRGLIPGLFVMGAAVGSGEQIGKGDAWILLSLGVLVGAKRCTGLFITALVLSLPFAAVWHLTGGRKQRKQKNGSEERRNGSGMRQNGSEERQNGSEERQEAEAGDHGEAVPFAPELLLAYLLWT